MSKEIEKYMLVSDYAKACGISTAAIYNRRKRGRIELLKVNGNWCVDTESYKPGRSGRPKKKTNEKEEN